MESFHAEVHMSVLPIFTYDHPILRRKLELVRDVTDDIVRLSIDMHETMRNAEGIGLAANQVGRDLAMTVIDVSDVEGSESVAPLTVINPTIVAYSDDEASYEEGCLSLPDLRADVIRPASVVVEYYDLDMRAHRLEAGNLLARVLQHEIDHLNGIYLFDHLKPMRRALLKRQLLAIARGEVETEYPTMGSGEVGVQ